ncbi:Diguanylate cyclase/phosphodiesterase with PAS/PAC and GAF sensor(S) [Modestobacter italicus]|uniref:Diguanylate cyclase/phosphodiesterase with PAS/PAC and GAF sensor(S) n=1 Tax=Modestobacter italicus (strain DSM 44449 / CECT 9708 / BC 501) TaxID=2732864 RepID=I4F0M1_MODI5|nr:bifunctional diguanylate cyclase/phosphodiesterase [Modestobacter marinus]CCH89184.1 Diguanylate cyclase/phosphodiesterase with PAS/PAC and GAF sensor(S) [Modestobacter marinus]
MADHEQVRTEKAAAGRLMGKAETQRLRRMWIGSSLRRRFLLSVGLMLLPLVNLAAAAWFSVSQMADSAQQLAGEAPATWLEELAAVSAVRHEALLAVFGVCLGGVVLAALVGRRLAHSVLGPLLAIKQAADQLGRGNLAHRIASGRADELGDVARAFDGMAQRLQISQDQLAHSATHDLLTGLPNRRMLHERLRQASPASGPASGLASQDVWALLLIDLDKFKDANDSLGHSAGDQILTVIAHRLQQAVPEPGLVARLGGDEFAVLVAHADGPDGAVAGAEQCQQLIERPVRVAGRDVVLSASIGVVADLGAAGGDPEELLRDADLAMYAGKRAGGGRSRLFSPDLHRRALARLELEVELRQALSHGELRPVYQPVIDLITGRTVGVEALVRWFHPRRGVVPPDEFIPLAEESDLIVALGQQVLIRACTEMASWLRAHPDALPLMLNVNISARQLQHEELVDHVQEALRISGLPAGQLTLEITETTAMTDPEASLQRLRALVGLGVGLAIDDFGTGYSSLAYLQRFPIQTLKLDMSFIAGLDTDPDAVRLTGGVLRLAETLGLRVVAEGVERPSQADVLRAMGCPAVQGYLFGRPGPLTTALERFRQPDTQLQLTAGS